MLKLNCWDFKRCGREPEGPRSGELGVCPAATEKKLEGANSGDRGGRACWAVAGTLCGGTVQGTFANKVGNCLDCDFYKLVRKEEGNGFVRSTDLLRLLHPGL